MADGRDLRVVPAAAPGAENLEARSNLTRAQWLMWLGQQLDPDAPLYNMVVTFTIEGPLRPDLFARAFDGLVAESDILRTVVEVGSDGVPRARVRDPFEGALEVVDVSGHPDPAAAAETWMSARTTRRLAPDAALSDCALLRLGPAQHVWYVSQHHLVTDGGSLAALYDRQAERYRRVLDGTLADVPPLPQYADWAAAERAAREAPGADESRAHWASTLADPVDPLELYGRRGPFGTASTRVSVPLGAARTARLLALAGEPPFRGIGRDLSVYALFAMTLAVWLHGLSGRAKLRLGMPVHGRTTAERRRTLGLLLEMSPVAVDLQPDDTYPSLHRRVMAAIQRALRHTRPGSTTAEVNRASEVVLNLVTAVFPPFCGMPTQVHWRHAGHGDRTHVVRLQIEDFSGRGDYTLHFDLNDDVFAPERRAQAVAQWLRVLDAFLAAPQAPVRDAVLASAEERADFARFNETGRPLPAADTVIDLIRAHARRTPDAPAVRDGDRTLTYGELLAWSDSLAATLRAHGVAPGVLVPFCTPRSAESLVAMLGTLVAGGAFVPLDPAHPPARMALVLDDLAAATPDAPRVVLAHGDLAPEVAASGWRVLRVDQVATAPAPAREMASGGTGRNDLAYCLYTSGSTGQPKGVLVGHEALLNYVAWATATYTGGRPWRAPLFTSLGFDLTLTSVFCPLASGGTVVVYGERANEGGLALLRVLDDDAVDVLKLTPAHLALLGGRDCSASQVRVLIVGGEDLKTTTARLALDTFGGGAALYNEYGPTEATVGCMVHRFDPVADRLDSVPIGRPIANARIHLLDAFGRPVPEGVIGELAVAGRGVARGYLGRPDLTAARFVADPSGAGRMYLTGDRARWGAPGRLEFLGRVDRQVKIGAARVELGEIEAVVLDADPHVRECVVDVVATAAARPAALAHCHRCGLPSNYPGVGFDADGLCGVCRDFDAYRDKAHVYFKPLEALQPVIARMRASRAGGHDCVVLLSGGKDSTYMLYRLVDLGVRPLAFTLDNGFLSDEAKANIRRVAASLGIDHVFGTTAAMNAIFVDSLQRHANVCQGCYKTIYTLAVALARERGLRFIVTGLSRGQFFETRLTADLFAVKDLTGDDIDSLVLEARKAYHRRDDVVARSLDVDVFRGDEVFDDIEFVDFYRYCDVSLREVYDYLEARAPWIRPADTGRSTNCRINDVGIFVHKATRGYHNYALPYSWDVRLGHKTREEALAELDDDIDEAKARDVLRTIGYPEDALPTARPQLVAYVVADRPVAPEALRRALEARLPRHMVPAAIVQLERLPLTGHGKVDRRALAHCWRAASAADAPYTAPRTPLETMLARLWADALGHARVGIDDNFFALGGDSITNIQVVARAAREGVRISPQQLFRSQTIADLARSLEAGERGGRPGGAGPPGTAAEVSARDLADVLEEYGE